ncbi:MAG: hypothetical protein K5866_10935 [Treponema sp.]|nr:hypothetical protein [Treponema sp.]
MKKFVLLLITFGLLLVSCTSTIQEDVFQSTDLNEELATELSIFDDSYILIESDYLLTGSYSSEDLSYLHQDIKTHLEEKHIEPIIAAHLTAIDGLLYILQGKNKNAEDCYKSAKSLQNGDDYVLLLGTKLSSPEEALVKVDEILSYDANNAIILLEKGILLYGQKEFDKSVAAIDQAFVQFDNESRSNYRQAYKEFRDKVWTLYISGIDNENLDKLKLDQNITSPLTLETMVRLTYESTHLLEDLTTGPKLKTSDLIVKLTQAGIFDSTVNPQDSSQEILTCQQITRKMCARYLWNLYVLQSGNPDLARKFSRRFSRMTEPKSPVFDLMIEDRDFDAVLGVVENEIMHLVDGRNFETDKVVTVLDFMTYLKNFN